MHIRLYRCYFFVESAGDACHINCSNSNILHWRRNKFTWTILQSRFQVYPITTNRKCLIGVYSNIWVTWPCLATVYNSVLFHQFCFSHFGIAKICSHDSWKVIGTILALFTLSSWSQSAVPVINKEPMPLVFNLDFVKSLVIWSPGHME